jgi:CheY-like chemotaxis protein
LRQAQRAEAIGQLTGGVAHDFNNLLSVMLGNLDMLERDETDLPRRNRLGVVRAAGERGAALTAQLLAFSRRQPLQPQPVRLSAMVADMLPLLRSACGSRVDVQVRLPRSLPAALVDPTQLELVVLNLAINARDAMPTGGRLTISGNVRLLTAAAGDDSPAPGCYVALSVVDTGTGMAPDVMARAFEPFFTTKPPGAGSGLGLSQAFGVARQSGGTVTIDTVPGEGTQVHILLPCAVEPVAAPKSVDGSETRAVSWQILLVDDDPAVLETFEQMLRQEGHCVKAVSGAAPALAALDNGMVVDILITDVMMPGTTGPQLARMVWKRWPELPVMFISGFADPAMLVDLGRRTRLVPKPCRMKDILSAIADLLEGKAEAAEARLPQACAVG